MKLKYAQWGDACGGKDSDLAEAQVIGRLRGSG